jgi:predicted amidohydrolase YtcJ
LKFLTIILTLFFSSRALADADTVLINGKILTVDESFSIVEAIAIKDGKFIASGKTSEIKFLINDQTTIIDLKGKTVVPGFIDGHAHMDREGLKLIPVSLDGAKSIDDILAIIKNEAAQKRPGEWIVTMPMGEYPFYGIREDNLTDGRFPTRYDIDKVSPHNPVYIKGPWYYWTGIDPIVSIANSAALKLAGITNITTVPHPGMEIVMDASGQPNGIFKETGPYGSIEHSLMKVVPRFDHDDRVNALKTAQALYNAAGTTSIYEGHGLAPEVIRAYQELHEGNALTVRSTIVMSPTWEDNKVAPIGNLLKEWSKKFGAKGTGDDFLMYNGLYAEMSVNPQDAIRRTDTYTGWAGQSNDGALQSERGSLRGIIKGAAKNDLRINAITYSEASLDEHIKAFESVQNKKNFQDRRNVIEHLSFVREDQMEKIKSLGLIPTVLPGSMVWLNGIRRTQSLSEIDANRYVPLQSFVDHGIKFSIGTDNVPYNMLHSIGAAVTRLDATTGKVSSPYQKISRIEALKAATINGAYLSFDENVIGSIEVGKVADLAVLSDDYLNISAEKIRDIKVLMTLVGGKIVHNQLIN